MTMNVATKSRSDSFAWVDNPDLGKLFLRVNLGFLLIWHGINFAQGHTNQMAALGEIGVPTAIGFPLGIICEIICPIAAILGIYSRLAGLGMAVFMLFAIGLRHVANGHLFQLEANAQGFFDAYMLERQFFFLFNALALFFMGGGRYGLNIGGRWN
jgi:putative oxidoreductase